MADGPEGQSKVKIGSQDPGRAVTEAMQSIISPGTGTGTGIVLSQELVKLYTRQFVILASGLLHIVRHHLTVMLAMIHLV